MKLIIALGIIVAILAAVWILVLRAASREMQYPGIDDIDLNDPDIKAGR